MRQGRVEAGRHPVVRGRVYEDGAVVDVAPDRPGLRLLSGQPRAQRGDEVALEEVTMGRGYVDRPAHRWPGRPAEGGGPTTSWRMSGPYIGHDPSGVILPVTGTSRSRSSAGTTLPK